MTVQSYQNQPTTQSGVSVRIKAMTTKPSTKALTIQQKADMFGPQIIWQAIAGNKRAMNLISPCSGKTHTIRWNDQKEKWTCSCEAGVAGRDCYHIREWERELEGFVDYGNIVLSAPVVVTESNYSTAPNAPKAAGFGSPEAFNARVKADF